MLTVDAIALFLADRRARNCRPRTIEFYERELNRLARGHPAVPTEPAAIKALLASVAGAPETRHATFRACRAFYRQLYRDGVIDPNPMLKVAAPRLKKKIQRTLDQGDVAKLLGLGLNDRDRAMLTLLLDSGIRSGELRGLCGKDLGETDLLVDGKTGERRVPIHPETMAQLKALVTAPDDVIFRTFDGRPLSRGRVYLLVRAALEKAGLDRAHKNGAHLLRHSFGRSWAEAKGPIPDLQRILGHGQITTTMLYVDLAQEVVGQTHAVFSRLTRAGEPRSEPSPKLRRVK